MTNPRTAVKPNLTNNTMEAKHSRYNLAVYMYCMYSREIMSRYQGYSIPTGYSTVKLTNFNLSLI